MTGEIIECDLGVWPEEKPNSYRRAAPVSGNYECNGLIRWHEAGDLLFPDIIPSIPYPTEEEAKEFRIMMGVDKSSLK